MTYIENIAGREPGFHLRNRLCNFAQELMAPGGAWTHIVGRDEDVDLILEACIQAGLVECARAEHNGKEILVYRLRLQ